MTKTTRFDVVGIGNAIVDVLSHCDDGFLEAEGLPKGSMTLIELERAVELYSRMGPAIEMSGGAAANSMVGAASFGSRAAYIGKVRDDELGMIFGHDIRAAGVRFDVPAAPEGPETARSHILVTPDAHRTMFNLPRRRRRARPRGRRHRPDRGLLDPLPGGLPLGQAARQERLPRRHGRGP